MFFFENLKSGVDETIHEIQRLSGPLEIYREGPVSIPEIKISFSTTNQGIKTRKRTKYEYNYELEKLSGSRNYTEFEMYKSFLISHCEDNNLSKKLMVQLKMELEHMNMHLNDELEYYSAYKYICKILKQDR